MTAPHVAKVHFLNTGDGKLIFKKYMRAIPRLGDELRLGVDVYVRVELVVWCLDETEPGVERVNLGVAPVKT